MITRNRAESAVDVELVGRRRIATAAPGHSLRNGALTSLIMALAVIVIFVGGMPGGPHIRWPWSNEITLHVHLSDSRALAPHAAVQVAGIKVGEVQSVTGDGSGAVATFTITGAGTADIRSDATVLLRPHGLFGPKYLDIQPGTSTQRMGDGSTIDARHTVQPVDLDQVLAALQAPEQTNLRTALVELGQASQNRGADVNQLLVSANHLTSDIQPAMQTLSGDAPALDDLILKDESFNAAFSQTPLDELVANNNTTLQAVADRSDHLQSLLVHANSSLAQLNADLGGQTGNARAIIDALPKTIDNLNTFNSNLALFANNLSGKDTTVPNDTNVTNGIIAAIENPKSAFSSYDCAVQQNPCPPDQRRYYLRVQVFNLAGSGGVTTSAFPLCNLPILTLPGSPHLPCPAQTTAAQVPGTGPATSSADIAAYAALLAG